MLKEKFLSDEMEKKERTASCPLDEDVVCVGELGCSIE